jgi:hypothetical protein
MKVLLGISYMITPTNESAPIVGIRNNRLIGIFHIIIILNK